ncbi:MAG: alanine racemase [Acidobacteriota bacterium]
MEKDKGGLIQWVELDVASLKHNIDEFRRLVGKNVEICGVVKANAYGHGLLEISKFLEGNGIDWFGVNCLEEASCLRRNKVELPIIILGYVPPVDLKEVSENNFRITLYNEEVIEELGNVSSEINKKIFIHLKLETGTNRQGIRKENLGDFVKKIKKHKNLYIEGVSTHFANIEDTTDHTYAMEQLERFREMAKIVHRNTENTLMKHTACTAATILFPKTYFNMVRVGIGLYGLWPSRETLLSSKRNGRRSITLRPVLAWKTRIAQIKNVSKGEYIGYGCTYKTTRNSKIAVIPVGYYDGYDRKLSNNSYALIKGMRAPVRGRVAMNMFMVDVTDIPGVSLEDEVVLLGRQGNEAITADYLASLCGTINYEIVSRINPLIPRITVK